MPEPASLRILSRTEQPCTSNHCVFPVEHEPTALYCAYAIEGGCIVVKQAHNDVTGSNGGTHAPDSPAQYFHAAPGRSSISSSSSHCSGDRTALLIEPHSNFDGDPITCVMWGGGPLASLAAASSHSICIFSLQPYFQSCSQGLNLPLATSSSNHDAEDEAVVSMPSSSYLQLEVQHSPAPILCMEFTHDGLGLLYSNAQGHINMLQIMAPTTNSQPPGGSVSLLWHAKADHPHHLVAAGATAEGPCASLPLDQPQRVMIWWPSPDPRSDGYTVGAEVIRHPVRVTGLAWSPPLQDGSRGAYDDLSQPAQSSTTAAAAGSPRAVGAAEACSSSSSISSPRHPALMTVGVDGVIRIWVEVVLADLHAGSSKPTPTPAAAAAASRWSPLGSPTKQSSGKSPLSAASGPAASLSSPSAHAQVPQTLTQFCLTLVIEPPGWGAAQGLWPGMTATWARPMTAPPTTSISISSAVTAAPVGTGAEAAASLVRQSGGPMMASPLDGLVWPTSPGSPAPSPYAPAAAGGGAGGVASGSRLLWLVGSFLAPSPEAHPGMQQQSAGSPVPPAAAMGPPQLGFPGSSQLPAGAFAAHPGGMPGDPSVSQQPARQLGASPVGGGPAGVSPRRLQLPLPGPGGSPAAAWGIHHQQQQQQQQEVAYQDQVFLWAVDGLTGVVLSGMAHNSIMASKLSTPRALLWGRSPHPAGWQRPDVLLGSAGSYGAASAAAARGGGSAGQGVIAALQVWAWSGLPRPLPLLSAAQQYHHPSSRTSELRTFHVLPLSSQPEGSPPISSVAVLPQHTRVAEGSMPQWRAVAVHSAAAVALTLSAARQLAFWAVAPVRQLHIAPDAVVVGPEDAAGGGSTPFNLCSSSGLGGAPTAAAAAGGGGGAAGVQLPRSWSAVQTACWLSCVWPEATAATAAGQQLPVLLLATIGCDCLEVCALTLQYSSGSTAGSMGPGWQIAAVQVLFTEQLTQEGQRLRHLSEMATVGCNVEGDYMGGSIPYITSLLAVAASDPESPRSAALAAHTGTSLTPAHSAGETWQSWQLAIACDPAGGCRTVARGSSHSSVLQLPVFQVQLLGQSSTAAAIPEAAAVALAASSSSRGGSGRTTPETAAPGRPATSADAAGKLGQPQQQQVPVSVSALHVPSPASPFFMTGDTSGHIYIWCALPPGGASPQPPAGLHTARPATQVVDAAAEAASAAREAAGSSSSSGPAGEAVALVQASSCSMLGTQLGGVVVAVALCTTAGFAAAATTCGQMEVEDAVFIWSSGSGAALNRWRAGGQHGQPPVFDLDCLLPLEDTAAALSWLDCAGLPPLLAVGYASGLLELYARDRRGQWTTMAVYQGCLPISALAVTPQGLPLAVAGSQLQLFTNLVDPAAAEQLSAGGESSSSSSRGTAWLQPAAAAAAQQQQQQQAPRMLTAAQLVSSTSGTVPLYHPDFLALLVSRGRLEAAVQVLRVLLTWLRGAAASLPDASATAAEETEQLQPTAPTAAAAGGAVVLPRQPPVELLTQGSSLLHAAGLAMCQQLRQALAAGGMTAAAAVAAAAATAASTSASVAGHSSGASSSGGEAVAAPSTPEPALTRKIPAAAASVGSGGSALDTGMLDMSAFGGFGDFGGGHDAEDSDKQQHQQPSKAAPTQPPAAAPLESGLLDMSAFGDFGGGGMQDTDSPKQQQQQRQQQQQQDGLGPAAAGPAATSSSHSALESGMVDSSAFGMDYGVGTPTHAAQPAASAANAGSGSAGGGGSKALETGMLDLSAFGMGDLEDSSGADAGGSSSAAAVPAAQLQGASDPTPQQQQQQSPGGAEGLPGTSTSDNSNSSSSPLTIQQLASCWALLPKQPAPAATGAAASTTSTASSSILGLMGRSRSPVVASSTSQQQQQVLLKQEELQELHQLLQLPLMAVSAEDPAAGSGLQDAAYFSRLLDAATTAGAESNRRRQQKSTAVKPAVAEGNQELLQLLGLQVEQAKQLCDVAGALTEDTFSGGQGEGSSAGLAKLFRATAATPFSTGSTSTGLYFQLDAAARLLVANVQVAVAELRRHQQQQEQSGGAAGSSREDRFAAAVRRLFQPVSVSRSAASALGRGAALLAHYPEASTRNLGLSSQGSTSPSAGGRMGWGGGEGGPSRLLRSLAESSISNNSSSFSRGPRGMGSSSRPPTGLRTSMSVASVLSFSSLKEGGSSEAAAAAETDVQARLHSRSWAAFMGLLPGVTPLMCLWAAASHTQSALVEALLPLCPEALTHATAPGSTAAAAGASSSTTTATASSLLGSTGTSGSMSMSSTSRPPSGAASSSGSGALTWSKLRALGAGLWLTELTALRSTCEALARAQYAAAKDPHDCALMYIALGKKQLVQGLFKSAGNKKVSEFLARDFQQPDHRAAAAKNAFALLGQHRHELAAAFFLLAGAGRDAVGVLAREAADPQLALVVSRLVEGAAAAAGAGGGSGGMPWAAAAGAGAGGVIAQGERLLERLVDEELLQLAEVDPDPACAALLHWTKGCQPQAVATLLQQPLLPPTAAAAGASAKGAGRGAAGSASESASPSVGGKSSSRERSLVKQPAVLDWVLTVGLPQLAGQPVPGLLLPAVQSLAVQVAQAAEVAGLPLAAAEAAAVADAVLGCSGSVSGSNPSKCIGGGADATASAIASAVAEEGGSSSAAAAVAQEAATALQAAMDLMWRSRLAAACVALLASPVGAESCLPEGGAGSAGGTSNLAASNALLMQSEQQAGQLAWGRDLPSFSMQQQQLGADAAIGINPQQQQQQQQQQQLVQPLPPLDCQDLAVWQDYVDTQLHQLKPWLRLQVDSAAVAACLQRHQRAFLPVTQLPVAAGVLLGTPWADALGPVDADILSRTGSLVGFGAPAQDTALQICLSRTSSALEGLVSPHSVGVDGGGGSSSKRSSTAGGLLAAAAVNAHGGQTWTARRVSSGGLGRLGAHLHQLKTRHSSSSIQQEHAHQQQQGLLGSSWDLVVADGDRCKAVAVCSGTEYSLGVRGRPRPLVYVTHKGGIATSSVAAPADEVIPASATSSVASQNSLLSGLMQQMLDHVRWPPDPWVVGEYPTRRSHSFSAANMGQVSCSALAAHPLRPLFVSGSSSGHIYIWCFGDQQSRAAYIPITAQVSKRQQIYEGVNTPHWGAPVALRFSRSGARFGAVGEGGGAGLWRQDFISAADGLGHAEWVAPVASRGAVDLDFLGDTGSQLLVAGHTERGWGVALWDSLAPPANACAGEARLTRPRATPTTISLMPATAAGPGPGALLLVGDDQGYLSALDVRMLGDNGWVWQERVHGAAVAGVALWDVRGPGAAAASGLGRSSSSSSTAPMQLSDVVVSGGRDGSIAVVNVHSGSTVQLLERAHFSEKRGLLGGRTSRVTPGTSWDAPTRRPLKASSVAAAVTGVATCGEGVLSCGADGAVRLHPFAHLGL